MSVLTVSLRAQTTTARDRYVVRLSVRTPAWTEAAIDSFAGPASHLSYRYTAGIFGFAGALPDSVVERLKTDPFVISVENDRYIWEPSPDGFRGAADVDKIWPLKDIDADPRPPLTGKGVHVYVLDTGLRATHVEFGGRATLAYDALPRTDNENGDCNGHGTHVAGTIAGKNYGIAPNATVIGVRVLGCDSWGLIASVMEGLTWVFEHAEKPAVVNLSFVAERTKGFPLVFDTLLSRVVEAGIVVVASAGNENDESCHYAPAAVRTALVVAAVNEEHIRWPSSNFGRCVDFFAPGVSIWSASPQDDNTYRLRNGTSMATAVVSGIVALILEQHPTFSSADVRKSLTEAAASDVRRLRENDPNRRVRLPSVPTVVNAR
jgi:subtilisin family serine protease